MEEKKVLLVEDNEGDIELTKLVLGDCKTKTTLTIIKNGKDALNFLLKRDQFSNSTSPDLVLLDIKLPEKNGFEVLQTLRADPKLSKIKVAVLTSGDSVASFEENYNVKADQYFEKPIPLDQLESFLKNSN